ncbi:hypothetical protein B0H94_104185 [Salsuginibacillus halophilus]|uniref:Tic20 family protein n=1 Tax=Salsuginibacillus halophilus TaxID=517424 RepID=A0A2P8HQX2_9BACI|nr:DUF4870 domain-containing protein [Salsuginibacillus halophilus]PSL48584.1 hypothetical protein B0H94_104185 [Salsuginibacillus halophilus]
MAEEKPQEVQPPENERTLAMLVHLLGIFTWFVGPLVLWLVKREESAFIDYHGKQALNLHISAAIYNIAAGILSIIFIGFLFMAAIGIYVLIVIILACMRAYAGEHYNIPLTIPILK